MVSFKTNFISENMSHFMLIIGVLLHIVHTGIFTQSIKKTDAIYTDRNQLLLTVNLLCSIVMFILLLTFTIDKEPKPTQLNTTLYYAFLTLLAFIILGSISNMIDIIRLSNNDILAQNRCVTKFNEELQQSVCNQTNLASVCSHTTQPTLYTAKLKIMLLLKVIMSSFMVGTLFYLTINSYNGN